MSDKEQGELAEEIEETDGDLEVAQPADDLPPTSSLPPVQQA